VPSLRPRGDASPAGRRFFELIGDGLAPRDPKVDEPRLNPWTAGVEALGSLILAVGAALGAGRAVGIPVTTLVVRVALIPILAPLATRTRARQRVVRRIRPQIKALDRQLRDHPNELSARLKELHEANGIGMVDWPGLLGAFIQVPILIALFQAVLLTWEPEALTLGGLGFGLAAGTVSVLSTHVNGQAEGASWMLWLSAALPVAICLWLGVGVGLYLVAFYLASALQGGLTHHRTASVASDALDEQT